MIDINTKKLSKVIPDKPTPPPDIPPHRDVQNLYNICISCGEKHDKSVMPFQGTCDCSPESEIAVLQYCDGGCGQVVGFVPDEDLNYPEQVYCGTCLLLLQI